MCADSEGREEITLYTSMPLSEVKLNKYLINTWLNSYFQIFSKCPLENITVAGKK